MTTPRLLVTGCGRSGTQYLASVLRGCGLAAGHEQVFDHTLDPAVPDRLEIERRWGGSQAEVSWMAAPFLASLDGDLVLWHLIRDPLKSLRCWCHHRMLRIGERQPDSPTIPFVHAVLPGTATGTDLERAVHYLLRWNLLIERYGRRFLCYRRLRVEDLNPRELQQDLAGAGYAVPRGLVAAALLFTPRNTGSCHHPPEHDLTWDAVLKTPDGPGLQALADRYGYL